MSPFLQMIEPIPVTPDVAMAVAIAAGTLYCFLGYRVLKVVIGLTGFIFAGAIGAGLTGLAFDGEPLLVASGGVLCGAVGAVAFLVLFKVGIFFLGMLGALLVAGNLLYERPEPWMPWVILGLGICGGVVALVVERPVLTLATAAIGSWMVVTATAYFAIGSSAVPWLERPLRQEDYDFVVLASWCTLAVVGALAQFAGHRKRPRVVVRSPGG